MNHKWEKLKMIDIEAYRCVNCGCEKYAISYKYGGWDYAMPDKVLGRNEDFHSLKRPECKPKK